MRRRTSIFGIAFNLVSIVCGFWFMAGGPQWLLIPVGLNLGRSLFFVFGSRPVLTKARRDKEHLVVWNKDGIGHIPLSNQREYFQGDTSHAFTPILISEEKGWRDLYRSIDGWKPLGAGVPALEFRNVDDAFRVAEDHLNGRSTHTPHFFFRKLGSLERLQNRT